MATETEIKYKEPCTICGKIKWRRGGPKFYQHREYQGYSCGGCGHIQRSNELYQRDNSPQPQEVVKLPYEGVPFEKCPKCGELPSPNGHFNRRGKDKRLGYFVYRWYCRKCQKTYSEQRKPLEVKAK